jgi:hypothetical protein
VTTDEPAIDRIPLAHSVRYVARGLPEVPNKYGAGVLAPSEITLTYRSAPDSQLGRVHAYVAGRIWVDGQELPLLSGGLYGQHYDDGLDGWPEWLAEEARLHDPDASSAGAAPATGQTAELDRLRTENERMRHELEVMYGGAFDTLKTASGPDECSGCLYVPCGNCTPAVWVDGHPQLEAIAAAVHEHCQTGDGGIVHDDPRNIAVAAMAAVLPARVDRADVLDQAAAIVFALDFDELRATTQFDSHRQAWELGTIDAANKLRRVAAETPTTTKARTCDCPSEDVPEHMFSADGCTCVPFTRKHGAPRYCQPGDTVDDISGWEIGGDCLHHKPAGGVRQPKETQRCPAKHGALGRICELPAGHAGLHTGAGENGSAVWDGDAP